MERSRIKHRRGSGMCIIQMRGLKIREDKDYRKQEKFR